MERLCRDFCKQYDVPFVCLYGTHEERYAGERHFIIMTKEEYTSYLFYFDGYYGQEKRVVVPGYTSMWHIFTVYHPYHKVQRTIHFEGFFRVEYKELHPSNNLR